MILDNLILRIFFLYLANADSNGGKYANQYSTIRERLAAIDETPVSDIGSDLDHPLQRRSRVWVDENLACIRRHCNQHSPNNALREYLYCLERNCRRRSLPDTQTTHHSLDNRQDFTGSKAQSRYRSDDIENQSTFGAIRDGADLNSIDKNTVPYDNINEYINIFNYRTLSETLGDDRLDAPSANIFGVERHGDYYVDNRMVPSLFPAQTHDVNDHAFFDGSKVVEPETKIINDGLPNLAAWFPELLHYNGDITHNLENMNDNEENKVQHSGGIEESLLLDLEGCMDSLCASLTGERFSRCVLELCVSGSESLSLETLLFIAKLVKQDLTNQKRYDRKMNNELNNLSINTMESMEEVLAHEHSQDKFGNSVRKDSPEEFFAQIGQKLLNSKEEQQPNAFLKPLVGRYMSKRNGGSESGSRSLEIMDPISSEQDDAQSKNGGIHFRLPPGSVARKRRVNDEVSQCIQSYCGDAMSTQKLMCIVHNCHRSRNLY